MCLVNKYYFINKTKRQKMKKRDYKYLGTENNIVFGTTGSEDQFSFFPSSSETFNEDVDKFTYSW